MNLLSRSSRPLLLVGLVAMGIGAIDPLEGSLLILAGLALVTFAAWRRNSRHLVVLGWALALAAVGIGALFALSAAGGFGGTTGRSNWWALTLLPYPAGWILGLIGGVRSLRERPTSVQSPS